MRWTGERLTWGDILKMAEDREFEGNESTADEGWTKLVYIFLRFVLLNGPSLNLYFTSLRFIMPSGT